MKIEQFTDKGSDFEIPDESITFCAEHVDVPGADYSIVSEGFTDIFSAVDAARALRERTGKPVQVRTTITVEYPDGDERYLEHFSVLP